MSLLRHESKQVLIERAQEILRQHPEQVAQHLQDPEVLTAQSVAEEQTRQSVEQLTEELSKQIQLSEKLNRPGCSSVEQLLKQRHMASEPTDTSRILYPIHKENLALYGRPN
jgi:hypothetical protein